MTLVPRTLQGRLLGGLTVAVALLAGALAYGWTQLVTVGDDLRVIDEAYLPLTDLASRMAAAEAGADVARLVGEAEIRLDDVAPLVHRSDERAALAAMRTQLRVIADRGSAVTEDRAAVRHAAGQLSRLLQTRITAVGERATVAHARAERAALSMLLLTVALGLGQGLALRRALKPVARLTEAATRIGAGERAGPLPTGGPEELATLAGAFSRMSDAVDERDRNLQAASAHLRRILDGLASEVIVARTVADGFVVDTANAAAVRSGRAHEGGALATSLAVLSPGQHRELVHGDQRLDVAVIGFDDDARLFVVVDVTSRVADRARLARSERLALVGRLLAQVTHEVRNPLNAMSLHAELLAEETLEPEARALLDTVTREIRRLEGVTERYLDLARRRPPERSVQDPVALAREIVALEGERLRRLAVEARVIGDARPVELDAETVRRALLNLLRNAAEADARTVIVQVTQDADATTFTVTDDGEGMDGSTLARLFEPFFTTRATGTGLGMSVLRQDIEDAGGSVDVTSRPGEGTRVTLRLTHCHGV